MLLVSVTEFRSNLKKYLDIALTEKVALKSNGVVYEITPSKEIRVNPSPSNDPYFDDPRNLEALDKAIAEVKSGKSKLTPWEDVKKELGI